MFDNNCNGIATGSQLNYMVMWYNLFWDP